MPVEIVMPRLSDTMTEGTIARWLKQPGDPVKRGDALAEIETDKALMQYESFEEGTLGEIKVGDGQTAPLGEVIALLYRAGEAPAGGASQAARSDARGGQTDAATPPVDRAASGSAKPAAAGPTAPGGPAADAPTRAQPLPDRPAGGRPSRAAPSAGAQAGPVGPGSASASPNGPSGRVRASPLARRLAERHGIEIARLVGTGPGGRVVRADVEQALATGPPGAVAEPEAGQRPAAPVAAPSGPSPSPGLTGDFMPFTRMQTVVARRMVESKSQVPHIYLTISIDMAAAMRLRADSNEFLGRENGLSVNDLFVKAIALTLRRHPELNASYRENGVQYNREVNVGVAVALPGGLVVPVIRDADQKSLPQIAAEARALAEKARTSGLAPADYEGGTFSTSNLGMLGVEEFDAVVNPPQAAILAIGAVTQEPLVRDGQVVVGQKCRVTLSCDHRVVYGWTAGEFLRDLKMLLERPFGLVY